ncbi:hypothetical protein KO494_14370 [Lacinutrix sp. C3R15]|uniref:DUF5683 domain-containing protein n=1 Tax=Flavobacteriaceae TaxID=49546 RepID=UPI001C0A40F4|nr:DUF5683 domain-containing protein [Oceanihabitans sp. 1_MG-2023]MBU2940730.1 hypothetical protein [Lacinutrix sp. C3R15]MDO6624048.1 DUF5683 domain-containing protein [Oceanihabitans sp. 1_MG-2023]
MKNKLFISIVLSICFSFLSIAQEKELNKEKKQLADEGIIIDGEINQSKTIDPLTPARAAFYSAVLPGLGHIHLKQYWKVPVIYAGLGAGMYFYIDNQKTYNRYRDAYKRRLAGYTDDEFYGSITDDGLEEAQSTLRRNKELSLLVTAGIYILNIVWANVDAHLLQFNVDENLTFMPHYKINEFDNTGDLGLTLNFKF